MQHAVLGTALGANANFVVSAPTGAGKTAVLDMVLLHALIHTPHFSASYVAPSKALCQLQAAGFSKRFQHLNLTVVSRTGDSEDGPVPASRPLLIVTTPEKMEAETRVRRSFALDLLLVDEVHHLADKDRGSTLEVLLTRAMLLVKPPRIVAVSATVPNAEEIAGWLGGRALIFDKRPCPLTVCVSKPNKVPPPLITLFATGARCGLCSQQERVLV